MCGPSAFGGTPKLKRSAFPPVESGSGTISGTAVIMQQHWPHTLWIVRHGESAGNVAREAADAAGLGRIDIAERDVDVPLSSRGEEQSQALGDWFAEMPEDQRPEVVLTS